MSRRHPQNGPTGFSTIISLPQEAVERMKIRARKHTQAAEYERLIKSLRAREAQAAKTR